MNWPVIVMYVIYCYVLTVLAASMYMPIYVANASAVARSDHAYMYALIY